MRLSCLLPPFAALLCLAHVWFRVTCPPKTSPYFVNGYVLSVNQARLTRMQHLLHHLHVRPVHLPPVPLDDPQIVNATKFAHKRIYSQLLTSTRFWQHQCTTKNDWVLVFEDDCALHPSLNAEQFVRAVQEGFQRYRDYGFFYLGLCGPTFEGPSVDVGGGVEARNAYGSCAHAYAIYCPKAPLLLQSLPISEDFWILDVQLREGWRNSGGVPLLGWNLISPQAADHVGLLFQDRHELPPENWT